MSVALDWNKTVEPVLSPGRLKISGLIKESIVDGTGIRLVVFAQGCNHHCPDCHNPHTHSFAGGEWMETEAILNQIKNNPLLDGITLSGGEPFEQAWAFALLADNVQELGLNVWTYTGYTYEDLIDRADARNGWAELLKLTDVLVDGQFKLEQKDLLLPFRGSRNQRLIKVAESMAAGKVVLLENI